MNLPTVTLPAPHLTDLRIAARLAELDNTTGGCLSERIKRMAETEALVAEQDRRTCEHLWALSTRARDRGSVGFGPVLWLLVSVLGVLLVALLLSGAVDGLLGEGMAR